MNRILYLHGFASGPCSSKALFFAGRLREAGLELEIPDLADGDFDHLTISGQLAVIERLAAGQPVSLIGSSMGGYLAALYAARHPETLRLVLLAPAFGFARRWPETLGKDAVESWQRTGVREVVHYAEGRMHSLHYGLLADGLTYEDYPAFAQPCLIFHGENDEVVPAAYSREFAAGRPNCRLEVLDSGHELHNVLDYMAPKVVQFLLQA